MKLRSNSRKGFTFLEILLTLVIMGYMYFALAPNSANTKNAAEVSLMKTRASSLNYAQTEFVAANGTNNAVTLWQAQANDDARYLLLTPYLQYPPTTLETFELNGFSFTFAADPRNPVSLYQGSTLISYQ
jgi:prepilin-type N-terminal cleavage/methylation domain-containing protein